MAERRYGSERQHAATEQAMLSLGGGLILLLGGGLAIIGASSPDRFSYCAVAGAGLAAAGVLIAKRRREGAWAFMTVFAITLAWSLRNLQSGGSSMVMRLVGPALLLGMIALLMPALRGWRTRRTLTAFATLLAGMIGLGLLSAADDPGQRSPTDHPLSHAD